jgi:hypothetical protein
MPLTLSSSCTTDVCACAVARLKAVSPMCVQRCTFAWAAMSRRRQAVVCMCVCMYVFIYYVHTYAYLCTYTYTLMLPVQPALAPFISAVPRDLVCVCACIYVYIYIHTHSHIRIHIWTHVTCRACAGCIHESCPSVHVFYIHGCLMF